jgi:hypothetical protein
MLKRVVAPLIALAILGLRTQAAIADVGRRMVARIAYVVAPVAPDAQDYADLNTMYDHLDP